MRGACCFTRGLGTRSAPLKGWEALALLAGEGPILIPEVMAVGGGRFPASHLHVGEP